MAVGPFLRRVQVRGSNSGLSFFLFLPPLFIYLFLFILFFFPFCGMHGTGDKNNLTFVNHLGVPYVSSVPYVCNVQIQVPN